MFQIEVGFAIGFPPGQATNYRRVDLSLLMLPSRGPIEAAEPEAS
jgi:hypothetical protein